MDLPAALAPWKDCLDAVSPEVATALGPWLLKLAPRVGPLRARTLVGTGEPDGYDGLVRRGPFERLLLSEWALAGEVPEEFVRRAAMRELGFHRMAYREPADARASVALFDAGPSQLGVPRLAHVAALLLLAQRAARAKARFGWGVLQRPPGDPSGGGLTLGLSAQNVDNLLLARQPIAPGEGDLDAWAALEARSGSWSDVWIVGPRDTWDRWRARVRRPGATGGALVVSDTREPDAQRVRVEVVHRSTVTEVTLTAPNGPTCVRLLRSVAASAANARDKRPPLPRGRRYTAAHTPASNVVFSPGGNALSWRTRAGAIVVVSVPSHPGGHQDKLRMFAPRRDETFLAVGWVKRRLVVLSHRLGALLLYEWNGPAFPRPTAHRPWPSVGASALLDRTPGALDPLHVYRTPEGFVAALQLPDGTLVRLDAKSVRSLRSMPPGDVFVRGERLVIEEPFPVGAAVAAGPPLLEGIESVAGLPFPLLASSRDDASQRLVRNPMATGAVIAPPGKTEIEVMPRGGLATIAFTAPAPIASASLHRQTSRLAVATEAGGVCVFTVDAPRSTLLDYRLPPLGDAA